MSEAKVFRGCPGSELPANTVRRVRKTAFFDRDGVLNVDRGYVYRVPDFEWVPGALEAVSRLSASGFQIVVATNQSGIGRGLYTEGQFLELTAWMVVQASFDAVVYCPHAPEADCPARKPGTAMLEAIDRYLGVDKQLSFFVGDKETDLQAADAFGIRSVAFESGNLDASLRALGL